MQGPGVDGQQPLHRLHRQRGAGGAVARLQLVLGRGDGKGGAAPLAAQRRVQQAGLARPLAAQHSQHEEVAVVCEQLRPGQGPGGAGVPLDEGGASARPPTEPSSCRLISDAGPSSGIAAGCDWGAFGDWHRGCRSQAARTLLVWSPGAWRDWRMQRSRAHLLLRTGRSHRGAEAALGRAGARSRDRADGSKPMSKQEKYNVCFTDGVEPFD
jgi:hypothetical protein